MGIRKYILCIILIATSTGCTVFVRTNQVSHYTANTVPQERMLAYIENIPGYAKVVVTRDEGFMGGGCYIGLKISGKLSARFDTSETAIFYIPAGMSDMEVVRDPLGRGLCGGGGWTPVPENYVLKHNEVNYFRISLGAYRRPRLLPTTKK